MQLEDVSIVIPSLGRPEVVSRLVEQVCRLPVRPNETIVVFQDRHELEMFTELVSGGSIRPVFCEIRSAAYARNAGAGIARGRILVFLDDDCIPSGEWLAKLTDPVRRGEACCSTGPVSNWNSVRRLRWWPDGRRASIVLWGALHPVQISATSRANTAGTVLGGNFAVTREAFWKVGGFDRRFRGASMYEETALSLLIRRSTMRRIVFVPDAAVIHRQAAVGGMRTVEVDAGWLGGQRAKLIAAVRKDQYGVWFSAGMAIAIYTILHGVRRDGRKACRQFARGLVSELRRGASEMDGEALRSQGGVH